MKFQKSSAGRNGISTYKNYFIGLIVFCYFTCKLIIDAKYIYTDIDIYLYRYILLSVMFFVL